MDPQVLTDLHASPQQNSYRLPYADERGFCHILLCGLGGDGANTAAKLLFKVGVEHLGLDGGYDAKYGSEKKGTPTNASVRLCKVGTPVLESGPTRTPHILGIFHERFIAPLALCQGLRTNASIIVNTVKKPATAREILELHSGTVICLDASAIAVQTGSRPNIPMLAATAKALGFPIDIVRENLAKTWPKAKEANIKAFDAAIEAHTTEHFSENGKYTIKPLAKTFGPIGYLNMLNGATVDATIHSTLGRDNRLSGFGQVPVFDPAACTNCGVCLTVCSDPGSLTWQEDKMTGINVLYCKGCMRCVEVCPETKRGKALKRQ